MRLYKVENGAVVSHDCTPTFEKSYDVVVAGLGTAGAIAVICAAEQGLNVLGFDRLHAMGGVGTVGGICKYYLGAKGGRYEQVNSTLDDIKNELFVSAEYEYGQAKEIALERQALKAGATLCYEITPIGVYREGDRVCGLRVFDHGEIYNISAKMVIDATAEAEISRMGGADSRLGRDFDGQTQAYTNTNLFVNYKNQIYGMNKDAGFVKQSDCKDFTNAIYHSNTMAINLKDKYDEAIRFVTVAPTLGVREGHTIVGEETISFEKLLVKKQREQKPIFYASSNVDIHSKDIVFEDELVNDWYVACSLWGLIISVPVPVGAIVPKGLKGIVVAGRALAVEHDLASCVRMKRDMEKCGEAAAMYSYLEINDGKVDIDKLRTLLEKSGCLDKENDIGYIRRVPGNKREKCDFPATDSEMLSCIDSDASGLALWSARCSNGEFDKALLSRLDNSDTGRLCALALALAGNDSGVKKLYDMVNEPDSRILQTSDLFVWTVGTAAIYLLGKLKDKNAVPVLLQVLYNPPKYEGEPNETGELYVTSNEVCTQYTLYAMRALTEIALAHPDIKDEIYNALMEYDRPLEVTLKVNPQAKINLLEKMKQYINSRLK